MSSVLSWDSLRAPSLPWNPMHHVAIKQEPMDTSMASTYVSESFHSASPSSSSRDSNPHSPRSDNSTSPGDQSSTKFRPLTPPEVSPENRRMENASKQVPVTPPKSYSPSPPNSEGMPSPGGSTLEGDDDPGVRMPAVNSHGKVKTFKCKQCEFVAVTKMDFWEHTRVHIKPERMLTCPKCPFVTEYKHHLEYHMRNHFGSKPYKCKQCSYTCVNKSMLSSHLKSHSNIYQYRCADCNYATKYCHSLKLHARKYHHQAAMVLNPDGTPNPLPIIDVYGTRRGPKQRTQNKMQEENATNAVSPQAHSLFPNPFNFPYGPLLQHPMLFPHNNNLNEPSILAKVMENSNMDQDQNNSPQLSQHLLLQQRFLEAASYNSIGKTPSSRGSVSPRASPYSLASPPPTINAADALDLTKSEGVAPLTPKNRRKGKAFKLERLTIAEENRQNAEISSPEIQQSLANNPVEEIEVTVDLPPRYSFDSDRDKPCSPEPPSEQIEREIKKDHNESYGCTYCDIVFKDIIMYTMHMGYHGFNDPFTCNMCGHSSSDKVSFFVHIARSKHS